MESKFKVGDRVAVTTLGGVSWDHEKILGVAFYEKLRGTIRHQKDGAFLVVYDAPPKQCPSKLRGVHHAGEMVRLKKRERRRVWLSKHHAESLIDGAIRTQSPRFVPPEPGLADAFIEFVEVRRKVKP